MTRRIDKAGAAAINIELRAAIDAVAVRHGLRIKSCKLSYTSTWIRIRSEIASVGTDGEVLDSDADAYDRLAALVGLANVPRGTAVRLPDGLEYVITGFNSRARKAPVLVTRAGKTYAIPTAIVAAATKPGAKGGR